MKRKQQAMTPAARWRATIDPIATFWQRNRGVKAAILGRLNVDSPNDNGKPWNRQQIDSYLHHDHTQRFQPLMGMGLALVAAAERVIKEWSYRDIAREHRRLHPKRKATNQQGGQQMRKGEKV